MALAAALRAACAAAKTREPLVALAAYGCPDLVAAIHYVGARPLYVDTAPDSLGMDLHGLRDALRTRSVAAIIGTDLFGLPERWSELEPIARQRGTPLIQDCAQSLQRRAGFAADLHGDAVVFSFGRGKPVCLLGGGAVLTRQSATEASLDGFGNIAADAAAGGARWLAPKALLYNFLLQPNAYAVLAHIMGSRLGRTRYEPLEAIRTLPPRVTSAIDAAVEAHWKDHVDRAAEVLDAIRPLVQEFPGELALPFDDGALRGRTLLRLPLLVRREAVRSRWLAALRKQGIGATTMYGRTLVEIVDDTSAAEAAQRFPASARLAAQLVTLPVHARLRTRDIEAIRATLRATFARSGRVTPETDRARTPRAR